VFLIVIGIAFAAILNEIDRCDPKVRILVKPVSIAELDYNKIESVFLIVIDIAFAAILNEIDRCDPKVRCLKILV
jgi:hypothetical protein